MSNHSSRLTALVIMLALALAAFVPTGEAAFRQYGTLVGESSSEQDIAGLLLVNLASATLKYVDEDNTATPTNDDHYYVSIDGGTTVKVGDVRVSTGNSEAAGTVVDSPSDTDHGDTLITTGLGTWAFVDEFDKDGKFTLGEGLFIDRDGSNTVTAGDIQVIARSSTQNQQGSTSWQFVTNTHVNISATTTALAGGFKYAAMDMDGDATYTTDDGVVIDVDANNMLGPGDIRLTQFGGQSAGTVPLVSERMTFNFLRALTGATVRYVESAGAGIIDDGEPIYLDADNSGAVSANDIKLGPVSSGASTTSNAGDQVKAGDTDIGDTLTAKGTIRYVDNNANGVYDGDDDVYLDVTDASTGNIQAGDLRLSDGNSDSSQFGGSMGSRVKTSDQDFNLPLVTPGTGNTFHYLDANGGAAYGKGDAVFYDVDDNDVVTPSDFQMSKGGQSLTTVGRMLRESDQLTEPCFRTAPTGFDFSAAKVSWVDQENIATAGIDETVYLDRKGDDKVSTFDVRISGGSQSFAAGTFILSSNVDNNDALTAFGSLLFKYHDDNGDGKFSVGVDNEDDDTVYLDANNDGNVSVADVRITKSSISSGQQGSKVQSGNDDVNFPLTALPAGFTVRGYDVDGNGIFNDKDALYLNVDHAATDRPAGSITDASLVAAGCSTPGDVRISGSGGTTGTGSTGGGGGGGGGGGTPSNNPPQARFTCTAGLDSLKVDVDASTSSDNDGSITQYTWGFGDGGTGSGQKTSHTYSKAGAFTITLTVQDDDGAQRSTTLAVVIPTEETDCTETPDLPGDGGDGTDGGDGGDGGDGTDGGDGGDGTDGGDGGDGGDGNGTDGGDQTETPAPGFVLIVAVLAGLLVFARRRL